MWDSILRVCVHVAPIALVILCFQMHLVLLDLRKVRELLERRPPPVDPETFR